MEALFNESFSHLKLTSFGHHKTADWWEKREMENWLIYQILMAMLNLIPTIKWVPQVFLFL